MNIATFLLSLIGPLAIRALIALGVGIVTVTGLNLVLAQVMQWVTSAVGGIPADLANLLALGGVFTGMSYVAGALTARVALAGAASFKRFFIQ